MTGCDDDAANIKGPAPRGIGLLLIDVIHPLDFEVPKLWRGGDKGRGCHRPAPGACGPQRSAGRLRQRQPWSLGSEKALLVERCLGAAREIAHAPVLCRPPIAGGVH